MVKALTVIGDIATIGTFIITAMMYAAQFL